MEPATVTTVTPLTVTLDSSATAIPALTLGSYAPLAGDRVVVDRLGSQVVVFGTTGGGDSTPIGRIVMFAITTPPAGYAACTGASVLRTLYPALSALWAANTPAYPYGSVDGTHMTLPNIPQGTFPTGGTPGVTGGEATHVLTVAEMPAHHHTQTLGTPLSTQTAVAGTWLVGGANTSIVSDTGGGGAHNNVPPFLGMLFAIRAA